MLKFDLAQAVKYLRTPGTPIGKTHRQLEQDNREWAAAARALSDAYLAQHPEDDAEPVTIDWLRSIGWTVYVHFPSIPTTAGHLLEWRMGGMWIGETPIVLTPTRGHVRRLCAALGIILPA